MEHMQYAALLLDALRELADSPRMEAELNSLEAKVAQFVALCERLRVENSELRQQLAAAQGDARRLGEKLDGARNRLERLLARLPE